MTNRQAKSPRSSKTSQIDKESSGKPAQTIIKNLQFKSKEIQQEPWIANRITVKGVVVGEKGFEYEIVFRNFLGALTKTKISRSDCFVNFPKVIAQLTGGGYMYDVKNPKALEAIQAYLTSIHLEPGDLKKAKDIQEVELKTKKVN